MHPPVTYLKDILLNLLPFLICNEIQNTIKYTIVSLVCIYISKIRWSKETVLIIKL